MKKLLLALTLLMGAATANAQSVGINTTPAASAALDVVSTSKGMLVPRVTTMQRNAITTPAKGLMVYDSTLNNFYFHSGTAWTAVGGSGSDTYPNVELAVTNTSQQTISNLFGGNSFTTLSLSSTNSGNAALSGGNTWNGTTFTVGSTGAGWYQVTANFLGVTSGSNGMTTIGYQVAMDKNNTFTTTPSAGTYPAAFSTYNSSTSSSILKNLATIQSVVYLAAGDYINFRAQSWSTGTAAYTSTDGSTNLQIVRLR